jgi:threonine aldolase
MPNTSLTEGGGAGEVNTPVVAYGEAVLVDLRSDTVTRPTPAMRRAMAEAEVGDDQYGEDPTVNRLQETFATLTGKEAALFVPSGTMANQIALRILARPGDAVVAGARQHIVLYEAGAGPANAGVTWRTLADEAGTLDGADVDKVIAAGAHHQPRVAAIAVEDTHMAAGGAVWDPDRRRAVGELARRHQLPVHLDGARLWHAAIASGESMRARAAEATTVTCCLSKGLGAPVGSVLAGPHELMAAAVLERKRLGGAMRQAGVLAAAGLVAMADGYDRLAEDHERARRLAGAVADRWPDGGLDPKDVATNIVIFFRPDADNLLRELAGQGVLAGTVGPGLVRFVTHADLDDQGIELACQAIARAS